MNEEIARQYERLAHAYSRREAAEKEIEEAKHIIQTLEWARAQDS